MTRKLTSFLRVAAACAAIALTGCDSVPQAQDGGMVKPGQGLLAFYVVSNADAYVDYVKFVEGEPVGTRLREEVVGAKGMFRIDAGKKYQVMAMDAGNYTFSELRVSGRSAWLKGSNRFRVEPGKITYIGHVRLYVEPTRFDLGVYDEELDMRVYLADHYPAYFNAVGLQKSVAELDVR